MKLISDENLILTYECDCGHLVKIGFQNSILKCYNCLATFELVDCKKSKMEFLTVGKNETFKKQRDKNIQFNKF